MKCFRDSRNLSPGLPTPLDERVSPRPRLTTARQAERAIGIRFLAFGGSISWNERLYREPARSRDEALSRLSVLSIGRNGRLGIAPRARTDTDLALARHEPAIIHG